MEKKRRRTREIQPLKWCICTEGKTEEIYLRSYCRALGIERLVDFNSDNNACKSKSDKGCGRQHMPLIDQIQICNRKSKYEKMIAVHDYDGDLNGGNAKTFDEASVAGEQAGIPVFYSIPCFEYWLLLHRNYMDMDLSSAQCIEKVKRHINDSRAAKGKPALTKSAYKTDLDLFAYFDGLDGVKTAKRNAQKRFSYKKPPKKASSIKPSSNLYLLLDELEKLAERR